MQALDEDNEEKAHFLADATKDLDRETASSVLGVLTVEKLDFEVVYLMVVN